MRRANIMAGTAALLWFGTFLMNRQAWSAANAAIGATQLRASQVDLQLMLPLLVVVAVATAAWICNSFGRGEAQLAFLSAAFFLALAPYLVASVGVV